MSFSGFVYVSAVGDSHRPVPAGLGESRGPWGKLQEFAMFREGVYVRKNKDENLDIFYYHMCICWKSLTKEHFWEYLGEWPGHIVT